MKAGNYIRTKNGLIGKLMGSNAYNENKIAILINDTKDIKITPVIDKEQVIKSSPNIIDLIVVGDYVNGWRITTIDKRNNKLYSEYEDGYLIKQIKGKNIETIVTKEQFKSMEYKVGD